MTIEEIEMEAEQEWEEHNLIRHVSHRDFMMGYVVGRQKTNSELSSEADRWKGELIKAEKRIEFWRMGRMDDLEEKVKSLEADLAKSQERVKALGDGIRKHRNSLSNFFPDNSKWYDVQKELYKLIEEG